LLQEGKKKEGFKTAEEGEGKKRNDQITGKWIDCENISFQEKIGRGGKGGGGVRERAKEPRKWHKGSRNKDLSEHDGIFFGELYKEVNVGLSRRGLIP